jgi:hypothetical protein
MALVPFIVGIYHKMHSKKVEQDDRHLLSHLGMELFLKVQSEEMKDLRPSAPFSAPKRARK